MDFSNGSFTSDSPIDRIVYESSDTLLIPSFTPFASFTLPNPVGFAFVPKIRYSIDGGDVYYENGNADSEYSATFGMFVDKVAMTAICNDSQITVYYSNGPLANYSTLWEITGIAKDA